MNLISVIKKVFYLDSRSLTLFRVLCAVILLIDFLFTRWPWFNLFYWDKGLFSLGEFLSSNNFWAKSSSLNFLSSSNTYQVFLFFLAIAFFIMLLIGYKTKWAVLGSWLLLVSFNSKNFLILNSGDILLGLLLFWALYLPLGEHFSIDRALKTEKEKSLPIFSVNSIAFIFQILFVYYFSAILKSHEIWKTGEGVYYALMLDQFRTTLGDMLLQYPLVMKGLSYFTYYFIENLVPFLFIALSFFWRWRIGFVLIMCGFHFSLSLFLHLGLFSWICCAGWLAFLPTEFWDRKYKWLTKRGSPLWVYYDGKCSFCEKSIYLLKTFLILPHVSFSPAQADAKAWPEMQKRNSWLVFSEKTGFQDRMPAFLTMLSYSPIWFWLALILRGKVFSLIGNWLYEKIASKRQVLGKYLPNRQAPLALDQSKTKSRIYPLLLSMFFLISFMYALAWNIRTTNFSYYSKYMPKELNGFGAFFHTFQYWNMFAPYPLDSSGYVIFSATPLKSNAHKLKSPATPMVKKESIKAQKKHIQKKPVQKQQAQKIDLWQNGAPLSIKKPYRENLNFPVFRLRKLMENLSGDYTQYSKNYLRYLCQKWNKKKPLQKVKDIEFIYMSQKTPAYGEPPLAPKNKTISKIKCP